MSALSFKHDVKGLFSKYVDDMVRVKLPLPHANGTSTLHLGNYESVKTFYYQIQVSIHGYDYDPENGWQVPPRQRLRVENGGPDEFVTSAPHPLPPDGKMPQEAIDMFDQWVRDGMQP